MTVQVPPRGFLIFGCSALLLLLIYYSSPHYFMNAIKGSERIQTMTVLSESIPTIRNPYRLPYKTVGALEIPADIYLPHPQSIKHDRVPVLFMIHGGAWIVGKSDSMSPDQINDSLDRGWIVLSLEHRLCPGLNLLEGPMSDVRDALAWVQNGGLQKALKTVGFGAMHPDPNRLLAMGASAGAHLALTMAYDVPKKPLAILDFFGCVHFEDPFWRGSVDQLRNNHSDYDDFFKPLFQEKDVIRPTEGDRRSALINQLIMDSTLLKATVPNGDLKAVDPAQHLDSSWPPTCIVHGKEDWLLPISISRHFHEKLQHEGIETELIEVDGEGHAFPGHITKGSKAWKMQRKGFDFLERVLERSYDKR